MSLRTRIHPSWGNIGKRCATKQGRNVRQYHARVPDRTFVSLEGADALPFLQGLVTANLTKSAPQMQYDGKLSWSRGIYTAFLNANGRVLHDVLIYPNSLQPGDSNEAEGFLVEVDANAAQALYKHLKKHKLRSKFKMRLFDKEELGVWSHWSGPDDTATDPSKEFTFDKNDSVIVAQDPRPGLLNRIILPSSTKSADLLEKHQHRKDPRDYIARRMVNGLAEGQNEIISGSALPQESNIDFFDGIDFRKGCYLGQELTIRTHHTGVVRKRILPIVLSDVNKDLANPIPINLPDDGEVNWDRYGSYAQPTPGSNISKLGGSTSRGRSAGKWLGGIGNVGLGLCRLEMLTDIRLTDTTTPYDPAQKWKVSWGTGEGETKALEIKAVVPEWMRERLRPMENKEEEDDEYDEEEEEYDKDFEEHEDRK